MSGAVGLLLSPLHAFMAWTEVKVYVTRLYFLNHALLDGPEIEFRWGRDILHTSRPALGPKQPPMQWVPGLFAGGKAAGA
jgi:hypothetical protein